MGSKEIPLTGSQSTSARSRQNLLPDSTVEGTKAGSVVGEEIGTKSLCERPEPGNWNWSE